MIFTETIFPKYVKTAILAVLPSESKIIPIPSKLLAAAAIDYISAVWPPPLSTPRSRPLDWEEQEQDGFLQERFQVLSTNVDLIAMQWYVRRTPVITLQESGSHYWLWWGPSVGLWWNYQYCPVTHVTPCLPCSGREYPEIQTPS